MWICQQLNNFLLKHVCSPLPFIVFWLNSRNIGLFKVLKGIAGIGLKIFTNDLIDHFYTDKVAFMDLKEFYEFAGVYYFEERFNDQIK